MSEFGVGFAMGLIVGQGSFTGDRRQPSLELRMHRRDLAPLELAQTVLGGRIFGPYEHTGRHTYVLMVRGQELRDRLPLLDSHLPMSWKRSQFLAWRARYREYLERPQPSRDLIERVERVLSSGSENWPAS